MHAFKLDVRFLCVFIAVCVCVFIRGLLMPLLVLLYADIKERVRLSMCKCVKRVCVLCVFLAECVRSAYAVDF